LLSAERQGGVIVNDGVSINYNSSRNIFFTGRVSATGKAAGQCAAGGTVPVFRFLGGCQSTLFLGWWIALADQARPLHLLPAQHRLLYIVCIYCATAIAAGDAERLTDNFPKSDLHANDDASNSAEIKLSVQTNS
jgi:hypothetical protein